MDTPRTSSRAWMPASIERCPSYMMPPLSGRRLLWIVGALAVTVGARWTYTPPRASTEKETPLPEASPRATASVSASVPEQVMSISRGSVSTPGLSVDSSLQGTASGPDHAMSVAADAAPAAADAGGETAAPLSIRLSPQEAPITVPDAKKNPTAWEQFKAMILGKAVSTSALSLLKKYQVAEFVYSTESEGRFAPFETLFDRATGPALDDPAWRAAAARPGRTPTALNGYLYSELTEDESGRPLDPSRRAGLCAYPDRPSNNAPIYCMTLDWELATPHEGRVPDDADASAWRVWAADSTRATGPVRRWPSADGVFSVRPKYTPAQAVALSKETVRQSGLPNPPAMPDAAPPPSGPFMKDIVKPGLSRVLTALQWYRAEQGRFPDDKDGLGFLAAPTCPIRLDAKALIDEWGHPYRYRRYSAGSGASTSEEAEVTSDGPDGLRGTSDDIRVTSEVNFHDFIGHPEKQF